MLTDEFCAIVLSGPECSHVHVASFTRIRCLDVVMAGVARWHRWDPNRDTDFRLVHTSVAFFTLDLLRLDVLLVREHKVALGQRGGRVRRRVLARMAESALRAQLLFVTRLAVFVRCEQRVRSEFACWRGRMAIRTGSTRIPDVKAVREFDCGRSVLGLGVDTGKRHQCQGQHADSDRKEPVGDPPNDTV
ncbi:hypothetical protein D4R75_02205 [bacterium]|nr:MAG: hypothetical protein D4R75_02205 [bacterium]